MPIIRNRTIVEDDWLHVPDDAAVPADRRCTVSLSRWLDALAGDEVVPSGVRIAPDDAVDVLRDTFDRLELVAIEFGAFTEGRGFSQARILRDRLGFAGELRAIGAVTRDRLAFMERCGIDVFELAEGEDPCDALAAFDELPLHYQPSSDRLDTVASRRGLRGV